MSERGTTDSDPGSGRSNLLWGGALVLAAAATSLLVLSNDARMLRLGLIAALWAALLGAFAVARLRHRVAESEQAVADQQRIYELELEREIAARREHEAEAEADARRRASEESGEQIRALQAELTKLRTTLEQVIGGDVLFERVALRAESTRVRSLPERSQGETKLVQHRPQRPKTIHQPVQQKQPAPAQATAPAPAAASAAAAAPAAANTDVMARLSGEVPLDSPKQQASKSQRPQAFPQRPEQQRPEPQRQEAQRPEPQAFPQRQEQPRQDPQRPEPQRPDRSAYERPSPAPDLAGAHTAGTSVDDLIAAYGGASDTQRRRRRRS
ncbi:DUF6779 domain-containing protein [Saccharopolyspora dendranthemae]|uniref:DUF6779 domain-containing protein n=1 Tax=Saccharopolyspora dendranthemae TaxID=1181886 RepID=A0A561TZ42_9PSEU|nr:DUF6779 domain-containing protein [Saccharopolyspora dendranthemae]TWF92379.1 hypothetical protein FHU35_1719 [Saccharopolyspora dendranthemae]